MGSSAYFFLVTFGFLSETPSPVDAECWAFEAEIYLAKCRATDLLAQHAMEEEGAASIYAGKGRSESGRGGMERDRAPARRKGPRSEAPALERGSAVRRRLNLPCVKAVAARLHPPSIMSFPGRRRGNTIKKGVQFTVMVVGKHTNA